MGSVQLLILAFVVLCNLFLAFVLLRNDWRSATNRLLALLSLIVALWTVSNYYSLNSSSASETLFWIRMVMFVTAPLTPTLYLFIKSFPAEGIGVSRINLILISVGTVLVSMLSWTKLIFTGVDIGNGISPSPGPGILVYGLFSGAFLIVAFWTLIVKYRKSQGLLRRQLSYIIIGSIVTFTLQFITNFILVVLFDVSNFVVFGPAFSLVMISFMTFSIVKYELFNIKVIATQVLILIIWIILFSKLFAVQSQSELVVDLFVFLTVLIIGTLLIRSVRNEVEQRQKLQELTDKLQALHKQKDEFISMAAHELRAPLTAVKGYVSMLVEGDAGELPEKARGFLADTGAVTDRMIRLVNNMLNVARIEGGRIVFQMEETSVIKAVQESYYSFRFEAERKGIDLNLSVPDGVNGDVYADPDRLREVVGNFVSNAIKYTEKGSVEIKISQPADQWVKVEVIDTGPGISEAEQKKLFQKFYRAESTAGKTIGTGLGLYISRLYIEHFKGKIGISSKVDQGSDFWFELPISIKGKADG